MPARRDRDDAVADELERVAGRLPLVVSRARPLVVRPDAGAIRDGEATLYGYDVEYDPVPHESGSVSYPGGWLEFRIERDDGQVRAEE